MPSICFSSSCTDGRSSADAYGDRVALPLRLLTGSPYCPFRDLPKARGGIRTLDLRDAYAGCVRFRHAIPGAPSPELRGLRLCHSNVARSRPPNRASTPGGSHLPAPDRRLLTVAQVAEATGLSPKA